MTTETATATNTAPTATASAPPPAERDGRVIGIDVLRGLAILWVMTFHLWEDMTIKLAGAGALYEALRDRLQEGRPLAALTAAGEVVLGTGFHGVSVFMILSGVSLTMNAYRRREDGIWAPFFARVRRLIVPYWWGVGIFVLTIAVIALFGMWLDGGSYRDAWFNVKIAAVSPVNVRWDDVLWALSVVPWLFREKAVTVPVGSMWFIALLFQYYLIFPFAFRLLNRIGPWSFIALGIAITLVSRALMLEIGSEWLNPGYVSRTMTAFAPFRLIEFTTGMAIGYALVFKRAAVGEWVHSPFDIFGLIVIGVLLQMAGAVLGPKADLLNVLGDPAIMVGMCVYALPVLFKVPGRLEVSLFARVLVFVGVISFPALIVNDSMRYVASFLRLQDVPDPIWWFFLVVIYIPVGVLIAYPLARWWGLLPSQRKRANAPEREAPTAPAGVGVPASG
jgi:peptidoglycan/LPS O-acetylase OafA/YrhL